MGLRNLTEIRDVKIFFNEGALVEASGTVTAAAAQAGDTVTVNGLVYTAVAGVKADNTEFSIDTGNDETAADLADSITNDTRAGVTVPALDVTAAAASAVVTITASTGGVAGNSIDLASSNGTRLAVSGANLASGSGNITGATMPMDAYKAAYKKVEDLECKHEQSAVADISAATTAIIGTTPYKVHVFTLTTEMTTGVYEFIYVETVPNNENIS